MIILNDYATRKHVRCRNDNPLFMYTESVQLCMYTCIYVSVTMTFCIDSNLKERVVGTNLAALDKHIADKHVF